MLAVKAKHATMLLTVSDVEGLPEGLQEIDEEKSKKSSAQSVMVRKLLQAESIFTPLTSWLYLPRLSNLYPFHFANYPTDNDKMCVFANT